MEHIYKMVNIKTNKEINSFSKESDAYCFLLDWLIKVKLLYDKCDIDLNAYVCAIKYTVIIHEEVQK